jgi:chromosomal replication initiation ATPase DnaA
MRTGQDIHEMARRAVRRVDPRTGKLTPEYLAEGRARTAAVRERKAEPPPLKQDWWQDAGTGWWYAVDAFDRELSRPPGQGPGESRPDEQAARRAAFEARLAKAGFHTPVPDASALPHELAREFAAVTEVPCDVMFTGPAGAGKTTLLLMAAAHWNAQGRSVRCARMRDFKRALEGMSGAEEAEALDAYLLPQVLLLDDLGSRQSNDETRVVSGHEVDILLTLHNRRSNAGRATWFTTNLTVPQLRMLYGDPLISRITDQRSVLVVDFTGQPNRRWANGGT